MIKGHYDQEHNTVIIEFSGRINTSQAEHFYSEIPNIVPKHGKGFKILTDLSRVESMDLEVQEWTLSFG